MDSTSTPRSSVGIIGAGRAGRLLGRALQQAGHEVAAASVRSAASRVTARALFGDVVVDAPAKVLAARPGLVLLTVPDDAIDEVVQQLGDAGSMDRCTVLVASGSVPLAACAPLAERGARVVRLHPLLAITPDAQVGELRDVTAAVSALDPAEVELGLALAAELRMRPFVLDESRRAEWHAAATIAANGTVALLAAAQELAQRAGLDERSALDAMARLAMQALGASRASSPSAALTGPVSRGDASTVAAHAEAIDRTDPQLASIYQGITAATVRLAERAGRIDHVTAIGMLDAARAGEWIGAR